MHPTVTFSYGCFLLLIRYFFLGAFMPWLGLVGVLGAGGKRDCDGAESGSLSLSEKSSCESWMVAAGSYV